MILQHHGQRHRLLPACCPPRPRSPAAVQALSLKHSWRFPQTPPCHPVLTVTIRLPIRVIQGLCAGIARCSVFPAVRISCLHPFSAPSVVAASRDYQSLSRGEASPLPHFPLHCSYSPAQFVNSTPPRKQKRGSRNIGLAVSLAM